MSSAPPHRRGGGGRGGGSRGGFHPPSSSNAGICFDFRNTGQCRFGSRCKYRHDPAAAAGNTTGTAGNSTPRGVTSSTSSNPRRRTATDDRTRLIQHWSVLAPTQLGRELEQPSAEMWMRTWRDVGTLNATSQRLLVDVLARIPHSAGLVAPPVLSCAQLFDAFFKHHCSEQQQKKPSEDDLLTLVKSVIGAVQRLLECKWEDDRMAVQTCLTNIAVQADEYLSKRNRDHRDASKRLMEIVEDVEKPWRILLRETIPANIMGESGDEDEAGGNETTPALGGYTRWKTADISWLCNPEYFSPSRCPKVKTGPNGVYDSPEEYLEMTHRLWVAMTFFDGHAALAPHCRARSNNSQHACGNALWPVADSKREGGTQLRCRTRYCREPVEYACRIASHDALCASCAAQSIANHCKGPGQSASTHIYDCKVARVESSGRMLLSAFKSRNPPPSIHWRTTKRLSPPNLVGVVRTKARGATLESHDKIMWGEIVYHGHSRDEERKRENGQLAVNLGAILDFDPDYFQEGESVAVIDCMTFVPEWIPVLKAIESQKQARLPFDNGYHLNLMAGRSRELMPAVTLPPADPIQIRNALLQMIEESSLEPICEIRRDDTLANALVSKLADLIKSTTLDDKQLLSFLEALRYPVHLTKGPPGTGKSYFGVVLVRALMIIRDLWMKKSRSTGTRPILVLSYKNRAIDDFLVDLVNAERSALTNRALIRIGGQCKDVRLINFSETSSFQSDASVVRAQARLKALNHLRESITLTMNGKVSTFLSYYRRMFEEADEAIRRKNAVDATSDLMECLVLKDRLDNYMLQSKEEDEITSEYVERELSFLALDSDGNASNSIMRSVANTAGQSLVQALLDGVSHYSEKQHWGDILLKWLSGSKPLPKCNMCHQRAASPEVSLCDNHRCMNVDHNERCKRHCDVETSRFCSDHRCMVSPCRAGRVTKQLYCAAHCCKQCITLRLRSEQASEKPPRNFCALHPLCTFPSCMKLCHEKSNYCSEHNVVACQATTKKGKPCRGVPLSRYIPYCRDHSHLAKIQAYWDDVSSVGSGESEINEVIATIPHADTSPKNRCTAVKKNGERCKGQIMPRSKFCYDHQSPVHQVVHVMQDEMAPSEDINNENLLNPPGDDFVANIDSETGALQHTTREVLSLANESGDGAFNLTSTAAMESVSIHSSASSANESGAFADAIEEIIGQHEEEGENLQHLRDVFEIIDGNDIDEESSLNDSDTQYYDVASPIGRATHQALCRPSEWSWALSIEERWYSVQVLLGTLKESMQVALLHVKGALTEGRNDQREAIIRAKARMYENKSIIGGTMVGCISRLESIRATRPFAVIVEEASEVLEPLLFSCLTEFTLKLEMVGDERQLQPNVGSRFDFEVCNKINVSMFQRLMEAPSSHKIPLTVLSLQRRMRTNICNLTREYYLDSVEIEDHSICHTRVLGNHHIKGGATVRCKLASTGGREVPGIAPHLYLWTHNGQQKKAQVGLSKINHFEATMACSLAYYLVTCGVPRPSIAILTPYKGQLMLIRNLLLKDQNFKTSKLLGSSQTDTDCIRVSTVDRFQGDEEDIIIASLVVDENSKTPFVKLENRMIVLLSRARLGMYILGNMGYFNNQGKPQHWKKTLQHFQQPSSSDSTSDMVGSNDFYRGVRSGPSLPICCPVHRSTSKLVANPAELSLGFCQEVCSSILSCGHPCSLGCHWSAPDKHNTTCSETLDSSCSIHAGSIFCRDAFLNAPLAPLGTTFSSVMNFYNCPQQISYSLKCSHNILIDCWKSKLFDEGTSKPPLCQEPSPVPYAFPQCGHTLQVSCSDLDRYNQDPRLIKCKVDVSYEPSCGHSKSMECHEASLFSGGQSLYKCPKEVSISLPRCGHTVRVSCHKRIDVEKWEGVCCDEIGKLQEGVKYGPIDHICKETSRIIRTCGHNLQLPCNEAFTKAASLGPCVARMKTRHPYCGHACFLTCVDVSTMGSESTPEPVSCFDEGSNITVPKLTFQPPLCMKSVLVNRKCGHQTEVSCAQARVPLPGCDVLVKIISPLCGHEIEVKCRNRKELLVNSFWSTDTFDRICKVGTLDIMATPLADICYLEKDILADASKCDKNLIVDIPCGHKKTVFCKNLPELLRDKSWASQCKENTVITLTCGHNKSLPCFQAKSQTQEGLKCSETKHQHCWNYEKCKQTLVVPCCSFAPAACQSAIKWHCQANKHSFEFKECSRGTPLECPDCHHAGIEDDIMSDDEIKKIIEFFPADSICTWPQPVVQYHECERELLQTLLKHVEGQLIYDKPLLRVTRIPCYRVLQKENQSADSFDPRLFARPKTLHGILTNVLSKSNISALLSSSSKGDELKLLVGVATIAKTKVTTKPRDKLSGFMSSIHKECFDSLLYNDKGLDNLIVWAPWPLMAVCRVTLRTDQLNEVAGKLPEISIDDYATRYVNIQPPPNGWITGSPVARQRSTDDLEDSNSDEGESQDGPMIVQTPGLLQGVEIDRYWPGGICSGGDIPSSIEIELLKKMRFVVGKARPFEAIKRIRSLMEKSDAPIFHLLMAAENIDDFPDEAKRYFVEYRDRMVKCKGLLHPWSLVVAARVEPRLAYDLLVVFLTAFPRESKLLTQAELQLVQGGSAPVFAGVETSWHDGLIEQWRILKDKYPLATVSAATEKLLSLTGLRKVKEEAIRLWKQALQLQMLNIETRKLQTVALNYCFVGNPGTGKTTVARLFAEILKDSGLRREDNFVELTAQQAKDGGTDEFRKAVGKALNGVLFIDEAYELDPVGDFKGKPIVNELLTVCENKRDELSVILAGYADDFQTKLYAYNAGLKSRFREIVFEDFDEFELAVIWNESRKEKMWEEEDSVTPVLVKRLVKMAGRKGFGNAREVRRQLELAVSNAMGRLGEMLSTNTMKLAVEDVIGDDPNSSNEKLLRVVAEFEEKVGWGRVKKSVRELIDICGINYKRELTGNPPLDILLNRMFLGNPGTGKTTCAKLYGRLLKALGFLSDGGVVAKTASDFIGGYIGQSQTRTCEILELARGKVLIIDEAYVLDDDNFGKQVLDTLVEKVQGGPSDDIAVLLLGYENQMQQMIRRQNPGLARRFPLEQAFYFDDYDDGELLQILKFNLKRSCVLSTPRFVEKALEVLQVQRAQANFGNAGAVESLVKSAVQKAASRPGKEIILDAIDIADPGTSRSEKDANPLALLDDLYRMEIVRSKLEKLTKDLEVSRRDGDEDPKLGHFVFTGSPGTGKTTVARVLATILHGLGLKASDKIVEKSALDLTADYLGQTKTKVNEALKDAKGGILFIDEAYNLGFGPYGKEACDAIVQAMTSDEFKDVLIVIAGYPEEIDDMLNTNSGLKSRFTHHFEFPDWTAENCGEFFELLAKRRMFTLAEGVLTAVREGCSTLIHLPGWGNGRDVTKLFDEAKGNRSARAYDSDETEKILIQDDVQKASALLIKSRSPRTKPSSRLETNRGIIDPYTAMDFAGRNPPPKKAAPEQEGLTISSMENENQSGQEGKHGNPEISCCEFKDLSTRDDGVSDEIWNQLTESKRREQEQMEKIQQEKREYQEYLRNREVEEKAAQLRHEAELERIRREIEREEQAKAIREEEERERKRKEAVLEETRRREEEARKREEQARKLADLQKKLQQILPCPMGFSWHKVGAGWRCAGGSHYVSEAELRKKFSIDL